MDTKRLLGLIKALVDHKESYGHYEKLKRENAVKAEDTRNKISEIELEIKELIGLGRL